MPSSTTSSMRSVSPVMAGAMAFVATTTGSMNHVASAFLQSSSIFRGRQTSSPSSSCTFVVSSSSKTAGLNRRRRRQNFVLLQEETWSTQYGLEKMNSLCRRSKTKHIPFSPLKSSEYDDESGFVDDFELETEEDFLHQELQRLESLEDMLKEIEGDDIIIDYGDEETDSDEEELGLGDSNTPDVEELFSFLEEGMEDVDDDQDFVEEEDANADSPVLLTSALEDALLQGVVPAAAGVGSECLPGDFGFDPLDFATKDYIMIIQYNLLQALPGAPDEPPPPERPTALILRDYREAEIRHGRLAMLAAVFWPLQEMLDRLLLDEDVFGRLVFGSVTLPYFPLLMTLIMMLLGYLDIYAKSIQEKDEIGEAFLPGDCFWDPLRMLEGAPNSMKRNMQERELFNGRFAMLAFATFVFEEATTGLPLIEIEGNELLFVPAYQIPYVQEWLDKVFSPTI